MYRSTWELQYMAWLDRSADIVWWSSEETIVAYRSPFDGAPHRYFPDFTFAVRAPDGSERVSMVEVKPYAQTVPPAPPRPGRKPSRRMVMEAVRWGINKAKWDAAEAFCASRGWEFRKATERDHKFL